MRGLFYLRKFPESGTGVFETMAEAQGVVYAA
jgi:hypothetical protein